MIVLLHVFIALSSLAFTTYLYFRPSKGKFYASYGLVAATLASGTYLVIDTNAPLFSTCRAGLIYLGVVLSGVALAYKRVASGNRQ